MSCPEGTELSLHPLLSLGKERGQYELAQATLSIPPSALPVSLNPGRKEVSISSASLLQKARDGFPMHHRVAVTPAPGCHFHPSFSNCSCQGAKEACGGRRREKMDGVGRMGSGKGRIAGG